MRDPSHRTEFSTRQLLAGLAPLGLTTAGLFLLLSAASWFGLLPRPEPADLDRTILREKVRLALEPGHSSVVLLGDSSCMMDVDASLLDQLTGRPSLNLGTLSYLNLGSHTRLLEVLGNQTTAQPDTLVLLMHPEALWHAEESLPYRAYLESLLQEKWGRLPRRPWIGAFTVVREQIIQPVLPVPLRGEFGVAYGSNHRIARSLFINRGSLGDPRVLDLESARRSSEFRLSPRLEALSREFRMKVPASARLWVGITPIPASTAALDYPNQYKTMILRWASWLGTEHTLTNLPPALPDSHFATPTHLNAEGVEVFTRILANELKHGR